MDRREADSLWVDSNVSTRRNSTVSLSATLQAPLNTNSDSEDNLKNTKPQVLASMTPIIEKRNTIVDPESGLEDNDEKLQRITLRQRLSHFTWAWFTLPMSCGGIALLIHVQPHQFQGLRTIGMVVYAINVVIFTLCCLAMLLRFLLDPSMALKSVTHPREGFFFPTFFLAIATLITSTQRYAIPKDDSSFIWATQTVFWAYLIFTLILAVAQYIFLFAAHSFGLQTMMPSWILPIFPVMLTGTVSSVILETQHNIDSLPLIVAGLTCQGLGFSVAMMMYAHMVGRLMQSGLPNREHRTGLFMCVGPPAFTALALIGMANRLPDAISSVDKLVIDVATIRAVALMAAVFLWALSLWWFLIAAVAVAMSPPEYFHLGWWPLVFPNTGFTLATISIGNEFQNEGILWFATAMSIAIIATFCIVLYFNVRAVFVKDIMYPGKDEDVNDH
ncbi:Fc.00g115170.m01.CDS01 [Cosmosporella sp. VM-42]